jgi:hypothetical protein
MVKEAKYRLIKKLNKVEVRLYNNLIIAEVDGYGDGGFNILFSYISGDNTTQTNLEMTSPVISKNIEMTAPVLSEKDSIAFVMPEEYTLENTPKPNDERIKIQQIPKRYVAALRFTGRWTTSNFAKKSKQLFHNALQWTFYTVVPAQKRSCNRNRFRARVLIYCSFPPTWRA